MAKTYSQLTQEIDALKAKAEAVRQLEVAGVVGRIKEAIEAYGLTAEDLGFGAKSIGKVSSKQASVKSTGRRAKSAIKYRDAAGHAWSGRGPRPGWVKAVLAAGESLDAFAVGAAPVAGESAPAGEAPAKRKQPKQAKKAALVVKYKDDAGHAWSGRGPKPGWFKEAIAGGKTLEQLAA